MELPLVNLHEEIVRLVTWTSKQKLVRLLEIDGIYLVSVITVETTTEKFIESFEIAFCTKKEAQKYMSDRLYIEFENPEDYVRRNYEFD